MKNKRNGMTPLVVYIRILHTTKRNRTNLTSMYLQIIQRKTTVLWFISMQEDLQPVTKAMTPIC